jgi:membrane-bound serine protease (ClpP class)
MNRPAAALRRQGDALRTPRARTVHLAFCAALAGVGLLLLLAGSLVPRALADGPSTAVVDVRARGVINPALAHYLVRVIDQAEVDQVSAVVIEIDTPGGLDSSMRQIIQRILASNVPIVLYVSPPGSRAASAGVYITYAAHVSAMAPNTNIGSATPVSMGENGEQQMSPEMRAKVSNDAVAYIRSLAEQRGRNADWAERAVREGANVTAQEAARTGVVDMVANDVDDLLRQIDGRQVATAGGTVTLRTANAPVNRLQMGLVDEFLQAISDPTIAYILISLGTMGMFFELSNPGSILPGVAGGICLLLGFYALGTLPVNYAGLLLMGFALLLFVVDTFSPTHGVLTLGGLASFLLGSLLLFNVPEAAPWLTLSLWTIFSVTGVMAGFFLLIARLVARSYHVRPSVGAEALLGQAGRAKTTLDPNGMVWVESALWEATADDGPIAAGTRVEIVDLDGLRLRVRSARAAAADPPAGTGPIGSAMAP